MARIYVSSTFKDLEECREKVRLSLRRMGHEDVAMEYYVAEDKRPVDKCLEDVASCDLYVGIFAWRYGYVPDGSEKSITELEYRKAVEAGKKCLIFLLHEDASWPRKFIDKGEGLEKIEALRNELSTKYIASFFQSADELASLVGAAVHKWERERIIETPAANQETLSHYSPSALPSYPKKLKEFVTRNRGEELNRALLYLQDHQFLLFTGMGGIGKTTIARALIDERPSNVPLPFWFDFGQNKDAKVGDILEKLADYMNCPDIAKFREENREAGKKDIYKLTDKLQAGNPVWLIFDNLETVLEDVYFHDEDMDLFFTCLHNNTHQARIIMTSRTFPKLRDGNYLIGEIEEEKQDIKGLKTNFAVDYLAKNGLGNLEPYKLEELAKGVDGHPLALKLLIGLVKKFGATDTLKDLTRYKRLKADTIKKTRKLLEKLAGNEKELLEHVSVYRQSVTMDAVKKMFTDKTPIEAVDNLIDESLLDTDHNGNYWLHPLVQEFAYDDLENKKEVHKLAMEYYLSLPISKIPAKKEDLQHAIEAHYHACKAGEFDLAADIIWEFDLHNRLDLWGNPRTLIEIYEKLLPNDPFKDEAVLKDKQVHGVILGNLGNAYKNLGETGKAIRYYEQALKIAREIGDTRGEGAALGDLGNAYSDLGEPDKAIDYYEKALKISRERNDTQGEGANLGNLGNAYSDLGDPKRAIEYYEQALKISIEIWNRRGQGANLGNLGNAYSDLGEPNKAIEYYEKALGIARSIGDRRGEGNHLGNLGSAYIDLGEPEKAIEYYKQALEIDREIGDRRGEGTDLGNMGEAYINLGEFEKAIEFLRESLDIGKSLEDQRTINFCKQKLKRLEGL